MSGAVHQKEILVSITSSFVTRRRTGRLLTAAISVVAVLAGSAVMAVPAVAASQCPSAFHVGEATVQGCSISWYNRSASLTVGLAKVNHSDFELCVQGYSGSTKVWQQCVSQVGGYMTIQNQGDTVLITRIRFEDLVIATGYNYGSVSFYRPGY